MLRLQTRNTEPLFHWLLSMFVLLPQLLGQFLQRQQLMKCGRSALLLQ
jgi:hypothetical protein